MIQELGTVAIFVSCLCSLGVAYDFLLRREFLAATAVAIPVVTLIGYWLHMHGFTRDWLLRPPASRRPASIAPRPAAPVEPKGLTPPTVDELNRLLDEVRGSPQD